MPIKSANRYGRRLAVSLVVKCLRERPHVLPTVRAQIIGLTLPIREQEVDRRPTYYVVVYYPGAAARSLSTRWDPVLSHTPSSSDYVPGLGILA